MTCPTLLLRGENSDVLPRAVAEQMVARGRNCDLKQVSGYGHAPTLNTDEQIAIVREFLES